MFGFFGEIQIKFQAGLEQSRQVLAHILQCIYCFRLDKFYKLRNILFLRETVQKIYLTFILSKLSTKQILYFSKFSNTLKKYNIKIYINSLFPQKNSISVSIPLVNFNHLSKLQSQNLAIIFLTLGHPVISLGCLQNRNMAHPLGSYQQQSSVNSPHRIPPTQHMKVYTSTIMSKELDLMGAVMSRWSNTVRQIFIVFIGLVFIYLKMYGRYGPQICYTECIELANYSRYIPYVFPLSFIMRIQCNRLYSHTHKFKHILQFNIKPIHTYLVYYLLMQKKQQPFDPLVKKLSVALNKSPEQLQPFIKILKDNWYDSQQSLHKLTVSDYQKMKIPHRIAQTIIQSLNTNTGMGINNKISKPSTNTGNNNINKGPLNQLALITLTDTLKHNLLLRLHQNKFQARSVLEIIYKLISNVVKDPYQLKFRNLKKSNNLIQKNIMQYDACLEFMKTIGFQDNGQMLELNKFDVPQLIFLEDCLNQAIIDLGGASLQQSEKKNTNTNPQQNMFLDVKKFPTSQGEVKQQFSQEKLAQMKYVDALQKLIEIRNKIMAQAPKNRRLRIYHKRFETKQIPIPQMSFEEQFQKSNDQDIVGYWKQILSNNAKSQKFQSKRKLQFQYLIKQKIHKQTLIKIKLPNELIIQAYFGPLQKLKDVFKVVADIVIGDLYLFTAPPKKVMGQKQMQKTLNELDAVPMGSFYLSTTDDVFYIQQQYVPMIQK